MSPKEEGHRKNIWRNNAENSTPIDLRGWMTAKNKNYEEKYTKAPHKRICSKPMIKTKILKAAREKMP